MSLSDFLFPPLAAVHQHFTVSTSAGIVNGTLNATMSGGHIGHSEDPPWYKAMGITLAVISGLFIGCSFIFKKKGLIDCKALGDADAGNSHAYLKSPMWWTGMTLMALGEVANFLAYAFAPAILVTPLGALSVVIRYVYYVFFTTMTLLSSAVLFRGFAVESTTSGISLLCGFFVIVGGVALLFKYSVKAQDEPGKLSNRKGRSHRRNNNRGYGSREGFGNLGNDEEDADEMRSMNELDDDNGDDERDNDDVSHMKHRRGNSKTKATKDTGYKQFQKEKNLNVTKKPSILASAVSMEE
ncbi:hypothetical protein HDV05_008194, partial [Chytridiales sp. JEL 0842]